MITAGMLVGTVFTLFVIPVFYLTLRQARAQQLTADADTNAAPALTS
jgi:hypothetical protein